MFAADATTPGALQPPPKKTGILKTVIALVVLLALAGGAWFINRDKVDNAEVGDCMRLDENDEDSPYKIVDCSDPLGTFQVLKVITDSAEECKDLAGATQSSTSDNGTVCMGDKGVDPATAVNVAKEGDCLHSEGDDATRVDCASADATDKVLKRLTDVTNFSLEEACAEVEGATSYYTWTWESFGGKFDVPSLSTDVVLCLGPAK